eukprot:5724554-Prymnesium_polylepis.1
MEVNTASAGLACMFGEVQQCMTLTLLLLGRVTTGAAPASSALSLAMPVLPPQPPSRWPSGAKPLEPSLRRRASQQRQHRCHIRCPIHPHGGSAAYTM